VRLPDDHPMRHLGMRDAPPLPTKRGTIDELRGVPCWRPGATSEILELVSERHLPGLLATPVAKIITDAQRRTDSRNLMVGP